MVTRTPEELQKIVDTIEALCNELDTRGFRSLDVHTLRRILHGLPPTER